VAGQAIVLLDRPLVWDHREPLQQELRNLKGGRALRRDEAGGSPTRQGRSAEELYDPGILEGARGAREGNRAARDAAPATDDDGDAGETGRMGLRSATGFVAGDREVPRRPTRWRRLEVDGEQ